MKLGKTQIRKQIKNIIFYIIVLLLAFSVYLVEGVNSDSKVLITNMLIIMLSLIFMLVGDTYNYSLNKIFMLFSFFFLGLRRFFSISTEQQCGAANLLMTVFTLR